MKILIALLLCSGIASSATIEASALCSAALFGEQSGERACRIGGGGFHDEQADINYGLAEAMDSIEYGIYQNSLYIRAKASATQDIGTVTYYPFFNVEKYGSHASAFTDLALSIVPSEAAQANRVEVSQSYQIQHYEDATRGYATLSGIEGVPAGRNISGTYPVQFDQAHPLDLSVEAFFEAFTQHPRGSGGYVNAEFSLYFFNVQPCTPEQVQQDCYAGEHWEPVSIAEYVIPQADPASVPEPGTWGVVAVGFLALTCFGRGLMA